jgi:hypothetical protein
MRPAWALAVATRLLAAGCGDSSRPAVAGSAPVMAGIRTQLGLLDALPPLYRSAREAMPTTAFVVKGEAGPQYVSDLSVTGRVVSVDAGSSFSYAGGPQVLGQPSTTEQLPFNAKGADVSDISLAVDVDVDVDRSHAPQS